MDAYQHIVAGVEAQACDCSGEWRVGDAWRTGGCGDRYEYLNDIAVRDQLQTVVNAGGLTRQQGMRLQDLDARLRALLVANGVDASGDQFWKNGVPSGVSS